MDLRSYYFPLRALRFLFFSVFDTALTKGNNTFYRSPSLMSTLILFATKHGCTEKCANRLKENLKGQTDLSNLKHKPKVQLDRYDTIVIGGSIHAGRIQKSVQTFCRKHLNTLLEKRIGLFICCMEEGDTAQKQFEKAFPDELREHAVATGIFGGEFSFEKMNPLERSIIKRIAKIDKSISKISEEAINTFISEMNKTKH